MGILFVVLAAGAAVLAIARVRKRWRFTDIPTSDAGHVFPGLSEVHGTVEPIGKPARAASDGSDCVFWTYSVQREQKDKNGSHWVTEESGTTAMPFQVRDASLESDSLKASQQRITAEREAYSGIDPNEELVDLLKYQRAFEAASKTLSVMDELMRTTLDIVR